MRKSISRLGPPTQTYTHRHSFRTTKSAVSAESHRWPAEVIHTRLPTRQHDTHTHTRTHTPPLLTAGPNITRPGPRRRVGEVTATRGAGVQHPKPHLTSDARGCGEDSRGIPHRHLSPERALTHPRRRIPSMHRRASRCTVPGPILHRRASPRSGGRAARTRHGDPRWWGASPAGSAWLCRCAASSSSFLTWELWSGVVCGQESFVVRNHLWSGVVSCRVLFENWCW